MRGNAARALLPSLVVLALVGVVAIAATGATPSGSGDTRKPADALLDTFFSLMVLAFVPAAAILVWGLMQRKAIAREVAARRYARTGIVGFSAFVLVLGALAYWRLRDPRFQRPEDELVNRIFPGTEPRGTPPERGVVTSDYEPEFAWIPVLVVVGLAAIGAFAAFLSARRRKAASGEEAIAEAIVVVLDDTLDDLRAEKDPRRAVIAAYARLERVLAAYGLARNAAETAGEYLTRILPELDVEPRSVRRLTDLFTRAKFSTHTVDLGMKGEAIDALSTVRDELQVAEARRLDDRTRSLTAAAERA